MLEKILNIGRKIIPKSIFRKAQPIYHYAIALLGALIYRFPSRRIKVIGVTGTKGKTSTVEMTNAILEKAGYKTAILGTLRFKIDKESKPNMYKMSMPGRFFVQNFIHKAVKAKCDYIIIEMTSEGARQFRNRFIDMDAFIFTNLSPEHIESHGSYEKYVNAKLSIARCLPRSKKNRKIMIINGDDKEATKFTAITGVERYVYHINDGAPYSTTSENATFTWKGVPVKLNVPGVFNIYNALAASTLADTQNISPETIKNGLENLKEIKGRAQKIVVENTNKKQDFDVIVDYAHTGESLKAIYNAFDDKKKICVLGNTGGGRDKWKRPEMGSIADNMCDVVILTNEDPYDEDPESIVNDMVTGIKKHTPEIIMDRRLAIHRAIKLAKTGDAVIITGKGTDPYIMEKNNKRTPWSDEKVAKEELQKILG